jgi:hypothetical protein
MDGFSYPPWNGTGDETSVSDLTSFADCEKAVETFVSRGGGKIMQQKYSVSKQWGRVLRAKVGFASGGVAGTTLVTCWSGAGPGVQMAVEIEGCGPQQAGC